MIEIDNSIDDVAALQFRDAERSLLANILIDPDLAYQAIEQSEPGDFTDSGRRALFDVIRMLTEQRQAIQPSDVRDALCDRGVPFSDATALTSLHVAEDLILRPVSFQKSVEDMKRYSAQRATFRAARQMIERARSGIDEPGQLQAALIAIVQNEVPADTLAVEDTLYYEDESEPEPDLGWVALYADEVSRLTASPRSFNVLAALVLGATAIKGRAVLNMTFGPVRPNLYGALIGQSTVYHKSTAMKKALGVLDAAGLSGLLLPDTGTSEGLVAALAERSYGLMAHDEIARLFSSDRVKYTMMLKQDLTAIFDGNTINKRLSAGGTTVLNPYVSILGATTPEAFYAAVGDRDWNDGFLVRWLWAPPDCEPNFDAPALLSNSEQSSITNRLANPLRALAGAGETEFQLTRGTLDAWNAWRSDGLRRAHEYGDDTARSITARTNTAALKLAMILAAVNGQWGCISIETMRAAIYLADMYRKNAWQLLTERSRYSIGGHKLAKAHRVIRERGGAVGCNRSTIQQFTNMRAHELRPVLEKLLSIGAVTLSDDGKRYRAEHDKLPIKAYV